MFQKTTILASLIVLSACGGAPQETDTQSEDMSASQFPATHWFQHIPFPLRPGAGPSNGGSSGSPGVSGSSGSSGSSSGSTGSTGSTGSSSGSSSGGTTGSSGSGGTTPSATTPVIAGCSVFPADNPWNTRVDDTTKYPTSAMSATYLANMKSDHVLHADWGTWAEGYGIPWQTVNGAPGVPMTFTYADQSDPGPYPFPATARVEGNGQAGDQHVIVLDSSTCTVYETYNSVLQPGGGWTADSGAKFNLGSNALRPDGWTSADAAGLPILPGLVRLAEVQAGAINHALRFTLNNTQNAYIHPATHAAGLSPTADPPLGLRLRLRADYPVASFSAQAQVILRAMQQYGMFLADNGSDWFVTGDSDDGWAPYMDDLSAALATLTGADFQVLDTGAVSTAGL